jgi:hypothetical protein
MIRLRRGYDGQVVDFGFLNGKRAERKKPAVHHHASEKWFCCQ